MYNTENSIKPTTRNKQRPKIFLPRRAECFQWILKQAETGLVAELKKIRTAVVGQIKGPSSLELFLTAVKKMPRKE